MTSMNRRTLYSIVSLSAVMLSVSQISYTNNALSTLQRTFFTVTLHEYFPEPGSIVFVSFV